MKASLGIAKNIPLVIAILLTSAVVLVPDISGKIPNRRAEPFLPPGRASDGHFYPLGTDYLGRPFLAVLGRGLSGTMSVALVGTAAVVVGCLFVGVLQGATRSRGMEALVAAGNLGVMAVPEAAVLITLNAAWPRLSPPLRVNASLITVLVLFAIPAGSRLIADRVRSLGRSGFVAASRAYGASPVYTFRREIWPHLAEDLAWIVASVLPRFVAIEVGLAYLSVEYREFEGLGRTLTKSFNNLSVPVANLQLLATIIVVVWVALLPQIVLGWLGIRAFREAGR